jgi:hypothetical protein
MESAAGHTQVLDGLRALGLAMLILVQIVEIPLFSMSAKLRREFCFVLILDT